MARRVLIATETAALDALLARCARMEGLRPRVVRTFAHVRAVHRVAPADPVIIAARPVSGTEAVDPLAALFADGLTHDVIAVGDDTPDAVARAFALGARDYLPLPIREIDVRIALRRLLASIELRAQAITRADATFFAVQLVTAGPPPLETIERAYTRRVLDHVGGRRGVASRILGISYPTFLKRLRELGIY